MPSPIGATSSATPYATVEQRPWLTCGAPGTWKTGQVLTCHDGLWNGAKVVVSRQWMRDAADIAGQTAATYTLAAADQTHKVRCRVIGTPTDTNYPARSALTDQTITVTA